MKNEVKLKCYQNYKNKCLNLLNLVKITTRSIKLRELHIKTKTIKEITNKHQNFYNHNQIYKIKIIIILVHKEFKINLT